MVLRDLSPTKKPLSLVPGDTVNVQIQILEGDNVVLGGKVTRKKGVFGSAAKQKTVPYSRTPPADSGAEAQGG